MWCITRWSRGLDRSLRGPWSRSWRSWLWPRSISDLAQQAETWRSQLLHISSSPWIPRWGWKELKITQRWAPQTGYSTLVPRARMEGISARSFSRPFCGHCVALKLHHDDDHPRCITLTSTPNWGMEKKKKKKQCPITGNILYVGWYDLSKERQWPITRWVTT